MIGSDRAVWVNTFNRQSASGSWAGLGGAFVSAPSAVSWADGRMDVFAIGTNSECYHEAYLGHHWTGNWESLVSLIPFSSLIVCLNCENPKATFVSLTVEELH